MAFAAMIGRWRLHQANFRLDPPSRDYY